MDGKLVIFDLDGTLLDTIGDLACSANHALDAHGYPVHDPAEYNFMVGNGISKLLERALPASARTGENIAGVRETFLAHYDDNNTALTTPYDGTAELLAELRRRGIALAVASNKYDAATKKLVRHYFPSIEFAAVYGNIEGIPAKPDPAIALRILADTGFSPEDAFFVGDSGVDMQTALNAGIAAIGVTWGFRPRAELERWNPAHIIDSPEELLTIVG